jgi:hypothetical protein
MAEIDLLKHEIAKAQAKRWIEFEKELSSIINRYNIDNELNIPDFILSKNIATDLKALKSMNEEIQRFKE